VVILVFTILLVIPIRRLRNAAEQIAGGNLQARVAVKRPSIFSPKDEMRVLMLDFNRMAARLESLVSSHRMLLRDVSHELRSPLARLGLASALARQATSQGAHPHLDRIDQESARLNNLIGQLLSLSAMEDNRDISIAPCLSLADLLRQMLPDVEYEASVRGCTVVTTIQGECVVKADPDLMHSALENILRNAIRYSPERGRIQVELSTEELQGGTFAAVQVSDNGPGVPPEDLEAILQPFYRVDKSRGSGTGGFGVGLAIANRAVRLYGGNIDIQNRMGGGLCVRVVLPLDPESLELRVLQVA
jgi:two-component system sensor histidine kinase CpxA